MITKFKLFRTLIFLFQIQQLESQVVDAEKKAFTAQQQVWDKVRISRIHWVTLVFDYRCSGWRKN